MALILNFELTMSTYQDLLMMNNLGLQLELSVETQVELLDELICILQLDPLISLD